MFYIIRTQMGTIDKIQEVKDVKDINQKTGVDALADLNSQTDLSILENKAKKMNVSQTQTMLSNLVKNEFKNPIGVEIGAHLLRGGKLSGFKNFLPLFPGMNDNDFKTVAAKKILESLTYLRNSGYQDYKSKMRNAGLWMQGDMELRKGLQSWMGFSGAAVDGVPGSQTIAALVNKLATKTEVTTKKDNYEKYGKILGDYLSYYKATSPDEPTKLSLCTGYASLLSEKIAAEQGKILRRPTGADAWDLYDKMDGRLFDKKKIIELRSVDQIKTTIISKPKGTLLTLRFQNTGNRKDNPGVSHVMVSMGGGIYVDNVGGYSRTIDMNTVPFGEYEFDLPNGRGGLTKEKRASCKIAGRNYIFTPDASLLTPIFDEMDPAENRIITCENKTPHEASREVAKKYGFPREYVYAIMMDENGFTVKDLNRRKASIHITIPFCKVNELKYTIKDPELAKNDVAQRFLQTLKNKKGELMAECGLDNTEYNEIAKVAFGILGNETDYGKKLSFLDMVKLGAVSAAALVVPIAAPFIVMSDKTGLKGRLSYQAKKVGGDEYQDFAQRARKAKGVAEKGNYKEAYNTLLYAEDTEYNSKGLTQIKYDAVMARNSKLAKLYVKYRITEESLDEPENSAIATFLFLADSYERLKTYRIGRPNYNESMASYKAGKQEKPPLPITDENIFEYLPYTFSKPSEIIRGTATSKDSNYIAKLKTNINNMNIA